MSEPWAFSIAPPPSTGYLQCIPVPVCTAEFLYHTRVKGTPLFKIFALSGQSCQCWCCYGQHKICYLMKLQIHYMIHFHSDDCKRPAPDADRVLLCKAGSCSVDFLLNLQFSLVGQTLTKHTAPNWHCFQTDPFPVPSPHPAVGRSTKSLLLNLFPVIVVKLLRSLKPI